jgi:2'-5' RNA ligase
MRLVNLVLKSKMGPTKGKVPKKVGLEWRPLRQPTELETAQAHEAQARADGEYIDRQVASPEEIAHSRWGGDGYSYETTIDWKARKAEKMVVDPIVKPEPEVLLGPDGLPIGPNQPPPAPPVDNGEVDEGDQPVGDAGKREARAVAQRAADSLPQRLRYDAIGIAMQKAQGVMIALYPPSAVAKQMAVKAGIPAEDLHITLAFLGTDLPDVAVQRAVGVAYDAAMRCAAPRGKVGGVGIFLGSDASNGLDVAYLSVDSAEIGKLRHRICEHLECCNVPVSQEHGFTPHITIAYLDTGEKPPKAPPPYELEFGALVVSAGNERMTFPFKGERDAAGLPRGYY